MSDPGLTLSPALVVGGFVSLGGAIGALFLRYHTLVERVMKKAEADFDKALAQAKEDAAADHALADALCDLTHAIATRNSENGRE